MLTLVRIDNPESKITLIRWVEHFHGWWGYSQKIVDNHRTACLFPNCVWRVEATAPVEK